MAPRDLLDPSTRLDAAPERLHDACGLWAGAVTDPPEGARSRRGRLRRWSYVAAAGVDEQEGRWLVGAAVVAVGPLLTAFAFGSLGDEVLDWEGRGLVRQAGRVGAVPADGARFGDVVHVDSDGSLRLATPDGWLVATSVRPDVAAVCATPTPHGGWNVTQKAAGERTTVVIGTPDGRRVECEGLGWRDWTAGRQDRHTTWRWAAGAGTAGDHRIGWNASTGMNERVGEDVVWCDGVPHRLDGVALRPTGPTDGVWELDAAGCELRLDPDHARAAVEDLVVAGSSYVQPWGTWRGRLRDVSGGTVDVDGQGVAEDHEVRW